LLQEPTDDFYTDEELLRWLNIGYSQFCVLSELLKDVVTINSIADTHTYNFPTSLVKIYYVSYDNINLQRKDIHELYALSPNWENAPSGTPTYYLLVQTNKIRLFPPPDESDKPIRIYGVMEPQPLDLQNNIQPITSPYYDEALINFILYKAKLKDKSPAEANQHLAIFTQYVQHCKSEGRKQEKNDKLYSFFPAVFK
jgi:hypothetical protein